MNQGRPGLGLGGQQAGPVPQPRRPASPWLISPWHCHITCHPVISCHLVTSRHTSCHCHVSSCHPHISSPCHLILSPCHVTPAHLVPSHLLSPCHVSSCYTVILSHVTSCHLVTSSCHISSPVTSVTLSHVTLSCHLKSLSYPVTSHPVTLSHRMSLSHLILLHRHLVPSCHILSHPMPPCHIPCHVSSCRLSHPMSHLITLSHLSLSYVTLSHCHIVTSHPVTLSHLMSPVTCHPVICHLKSGSHLMLSHHISSCHPVTYHCHLVISPHISSCHRRISCHLVTSCHPVPSHVTQSSCDVTPYLILSPCHISSCHTSRHPVTSALFAGHCQGTLRPLQVRPFPAGPLLSPWSEDPGSVGWGRARWTHTQPHAHIAIVTFATALGTRAPQAPFAQ